MSYVLDAYKEHYEKLVLKMDTIDKLHDECVVLRAILDGIYSILTPSEQNILADAITLKFNKKER